MGASRAATLEMEAASDVVRAAGGIVVRRTPDGATQIAVVHRPARADWSFPKGKLEAGETFEEAALREVHEETGLRCRLGRFVGHTEYRDRKDRPKVVAYWVMEPDGGTFSVSDEVDEMRWVGMPVAAGLLSYECDRQLLAALADEDPAATG